MNGTTNQIILGKTNETSKVIGERNRRKAIEIAWKFSNAIAYRISLRDAVGICKKESKAVPTIVADEVFLSIKIPKETTKKYNNNPIRIVGNLKFVRISKGIAVEIQPKVLTKIFNKDSKVWFTGNLPNQFPKEMPNESDWVELEEKFRE